jgi:thiamine-phosphate pyrophosphorylase
MEMPEVEVRRCRLCLVTPHDIDPDDLAPLVDDALAGGDVASVIIGGDGDRLQRLAEAVVPRAQARGAAALVRNDTRIAGRARADGVHIDAGLADLKTAVEKLRPKLIVGAGGFRTRHDAMAAGEANPDYLFFGRLDGDTGDDIFDKALDLAAWWSDLFVIPAIVMGGGTIASVETAARAGIEFVALSRAVFADPRGPAAAVEDANIRLARLAADAA